MNSKTLAAVKKPTVLSDDWILLHKSYFFFLHDDVWNALLWYYIIIVVVNYDVQNFDALTFERLFKENENSRIIKP